MYNRYIPQSDGSYRKNQMPDPAPPRHRQQRQASAPKPRPEPVCNMNPACGEKPKAPPSPQEHHPATGAGDFLRRLLPKDLDTGDLLVIVLLLLMAGDCAEEKNTALLTLALYMLM